jgi:hypothetical protein
MSEGPSVGDGSRPRRFTPVTTVVAGGAGVAAGVSGSLLSGGSTYVAVLTAVCGVITVLAGSQAVITWITGRERRKLNQVKAKQARQTLQIISALPDTHLTRAERADLYLRLVKASCGEPEQDANK